MICGQLGSPEQRLAWMADIDGITLVVREMVKIYIKAPTS
jgi:hypothetical protein